MNNSCENCSNRVCANSPLALWWDWCVDSGFTLFPQMDVGKTDDTAEKEAKPNE